MKLVTPLVFQDGSSQNTAATGGGGSVITYDVSTTDYGQETSLPNATTKTVGSGVSYRNDGAYDRKLKNGAGTVVGFIPPYKSVTAICENNSTVAGVWQLTNASILGVTARKYIGSIFGGGSTTNLTNLVLNDNDRQLFIARGNGSAYGIVYTHSTGSWGSATLIRTGGVVAAGGAVSIAADKVLFASHILNAFEAVILSISGTTITVNTPAAMTSAMNATIYPNPIKLSTGEVLISYLVSSAAEKYVGATISGNTVTLGTEISAATGNTVFNGMYDLGGGVVLSVLAGASVLTTRALTLSGITATITGSLQTTASSASVRSLLMPTGRVAVAFSDTVAKCGFVTVSSGIPSVSAVTTFTTSVTNSASNGDMVILDSTSLAIGNAATNANVFNILKDTSGVASVGAELSIPCTSTSGVAFLEKSGTAIFWVVTINGSIDCVAEVSCSGTSPTLVDMNAASLNSNAARLSSTGITGEPNLASATGVLGTVNLSSGTIAKVYSKGGKNVYPVPTVLLPAVSGFFLSKSQSERWQINLGAGYWVASKVECV